MSEKYCFFFFLLCKYINVLGACLNKFKKSACFHRKLIYSSFLISCFSLLGTTRFESRKKKKRKKKGTTRFLSGLFFKHKKLIKVSYLKLMIIFNRKRKKREDFFFFWLNGAEVIFIFIHTMCFILTLIF